LKKTDDLLALVFQASNGNRKMAKQTIGQRLREFCLLLTFSIALFGIAVLAYQSYFWLNKGYWKPLRSRLVLDKVLPANFSQWLNDPESWLGLNKIISPIFNSSLALFLLLFGLFAFLLISKTFSLFLKPEKNEKEMVRTKSWRCL